MVRSTTCVWVLHVKRRLSVLSLELQIVPAYNCKSMIHQSRSIVTAWQFANCEILFAHFAVKIKGIFIQMKEKFSK